MNTRFIEAQGKPTPLSGPSEFHYILLDPAVGAAAIFFLKSKVIDTARISAIQERERHEILHPSHSSFYSCALPTSLRAEAEHNIQSRYQRKEEDDEE
jgi:hypothetical protein